MRYVLWEWNVRAHSFDGRIEAAVAGGFDALTLSYREYRKALAAGRTAEDLAAAVRANGLALDFLDGMSSWSPIRFPPGADGFLRDALDFSADDALELCDRTGMRAIAAIAGFEAGALPMSQLVDCFGAFCDKAAARGIAVCIESMPMMGLPTLSHVWEIVREADRPNASVLFDSWHFIRGGAEYDLLESIPRGKILHAQIADGGTQPQGSLWEDAMHHREFPGRGEMPLGRIMNILRATQDLASIGPEALSDRVDTLSAIAAGSEAGESTEQAALAAGFPARKNVPAR